MTTPTGSGAAGSYGAMPPAAPQDYPAPGYSPGGMPQLASWGLRVGATLIDSLIMGAILTVALIIGAIAGSANDSLAGLFIAIGYVAAIGFYVWQLVVQGKTGQTIGKRAVKIRLLREQDGQTIGAGLSIARYFVHIVDQLPCYLGFLWPLWDAKKQTFADKILKTVVIKG